MPRLTPSEIAAINAANAQLKAARAQEAAAKASVKMAVTIKGDKGEIGDIGPVGPTGKSIIGMPGRDGIDGKDGQSVTGPKGDPGKDGIDGKDGVGPDEKVKVSADDKTPGFLSDKLAAGNGVTLRRASTKRGGERLFIDATASGSTGGGGSAGLTVYDDGTSVGVGNKVSFDGGDPVTISGGIIHVPVGGGGGGSDDQTAAEVPFTPVGTIAATDTQTAVAEVATDAASALSTHAGAADPHAVYALEVSTVMDGDAAGGVLSGTYPNPGFAADMATQAELNAVAAAAVSDGDAAGGDLSGTYPNPSVVDDSHSHGPGTAPGSGGELLGAPTTLEIVSGSIDATDLHYIRLDGEGEADDQLDEIIGGVDGQLLLIEEGPAGNEITILPGSSNNLALVDLEANSVTLGGYVSQMLAFYSAATDGGRWLIWSIQRPSSIMSSDGETEIIADPTSLQASVVGNQAFSALVTAFTVFARPFVLSGALTPIADIDLAPSDVAFNFDDTNGSATPRWKGKSADGTVVSGSLGGAFLMSSGNVWEADTPVALGYRTDQPGVNLSFLIWEVTTAGTTGSTEPDWEGIPLASGPITDNDVEWTFRGYVGKVLGGAKSIEAAPHASGNTGSSIITEDATALAAGDLYIRGGHGAAGVVGGKVGIQSGFSNASSAVDTRAYIEVNPGGVDGFGGDSYSQGGQGVAGQDGGASYLSGGTGDAGNTPGAEIRAYGGTATDPGALVITTKGSPGSAGDLLTRSVSGTFVEWAPFTLPNTALTGFVAAAEIGFFPAVDEPFRVFSENSNGSFSYLFVEPTQVGAQFYDTDGTTVIAATVMDATGLHFTADTVTYDVRAGTVSPAAGAGVAAPIRSEYRRDNAGTGELWFKTGASDTAWTQIV